MATPLKTTALIPPKAPDLPIAPVEYTQQYQDQFSNALRLYFNQIDNFTQPFTGQYGGGYLRFPHIAASYSAEQYAVTNTPTVVLWNTQDSISGFTLNSDSTATASIPGIYKITYSLQFANNDNAIHDAIVWLRVNGATSSADVVNSTTIFTLQARKSALLPNFVCGYSEVVFELHAGDTVGLWWGTNQGAVSGGATGIYMFSQAAQTSPMAYPAVPSAIGSITFVSAVY
jgi:hypothetical protein